jgi:hypothetical protein
MEAPIINETPVIMLITTALLLNSNIRNSVPMYSGKIAVPPGGGGK